MNEASIFRLFGNKAELFREAIFENSISVEHLKSDELLSITDDREMLCQLVSATLTLFIQQMDIYRLFIPDSPPFETNEEKLRVFQRILDIIEHFSKMLYQRFPEPLDQDSLQLFSEMFLSVCIIEALYISNQQSMKHDMSAYIEDHIQNYTDYLCKIFIK